MSITSSSIDQIADRFITVNGIRFRCRIEGSEAGPWLVFSNSLMTDLSLWDAQVAAFSDRFRILRYDQRGHGGTSVPSADCTFDQLVDDTIALFDEIGIDHAALVGISMGGVTALRFAARYPERVNSLAICDCQASSPVAGAARWQERIDMAEASGMAALAKATVARWFTQNSQANQMPAIAKIEAMVAATPLPGFVRCARALQSYDFQEDLGRITCSTLMLAGESDANIPETMRLMAQRVAPAEFHEIAQAGHLPNVERSEEFNRLLTVLLDQPDPDDGGERRYDDAVASDNGG
ncbi:alpha/beta fold hydrolase [Rhizobium sp. BK376]|uniref:alpha/beta fold hydrolase n=1 Tax=Rhizobium sp. BK376 TaxID=2512149 RepID=UPI001053C737|nr:alpha/beta fold hydrolase [Rhizobium sp. BK376]TCR86008.1 3-oxoadipate enol-lactonase [Rhizobium sp. BK376]